MEKIENGKGRSWSFQVVCKAGFWQDEIPCGESYEISEKDLVVNTICVMGECDMEVIGFKCPECGSFTEISGEVIPEFIRNRLLAKYYQAKNQEQQKKPRRTFWQWLADIFG